MSSKLEEASVRIMPSSNGRLLLELEESIPEVLSAPAMSVELYFRITNHIGKMLNKRLRRLTVSLILEIAKKHHGIIPSTKQPFQLQVIITRVSEGKVYFFLPLGVAKAGLGNELSFFQEVLERSLLAEPIVHQKKTVATLSASSEGLMGEVEFDLPLLIKRVNGRDTVQPRPPECTINCPCCFEKIVLAIRMVEGAFKPKDKLPGSSIVCGNCGTTISLDHS